MERGVAGLPGDAVRRVEVLDERELEDGEGALAG